MEQVFRHKFSTDLTFAKLLNFCNYIHNVRVIY